MFRAYTVATEDPLCVHLVIEALDANGTVIEGYWGVIRSSSYLNSRVYLIAPVSHKAYVGYDTVNGRAVYLDGEWMVAFDRIMLWLRQWMDKGYHLSGLSQPEPERSLGAAVRAKRRDLLTTSMPPTFREQDYSALRDPGLREEFERRVMVAVMEHG
jgi:hypothetical protein